VLVRHPARRAPRRRRPHRRRRLRRRRSAAGVAAGPGGRARAGRRSGGGAVPVPPRAPSRWAGRRGRARASRRPMRRQRCGRRERFQVGPKVAAIARCRVALKTVTTWGRSPP